MVIKKNTVVKAKPKAVAKPKAKAKPKVAAKAKAVAKPKAKTNNNSSINNYTNEIIKKNNKNKNTNNNVKVNNVKVNNVKVNNVKVNNVNNVVNTKVNKYVSNTNVSRSNFNKIISNCVKNVEFENGKSYPSDIKTESEYQKRFDNVVQFSNKFTDAQKQSFDYIFYNKGNNDGCTCAYAYWKYITDSKSSDKTFLNSIIFKGSIPGNTYDKTVFKSVYQSLNSLVGKNVLIMDLSFNKETYKAVADKANLCVVLDDHAGHTNTNNSSSDKLNILVGDKQSASVLAYKFFNPESDIPRFYQHIDNSDAKLGLPWISYSTELTTAYSIRVSNNYQLNGLIRKTQDEIGIDHKFFQIIHDIIGVKDSKFLQIIGKYMTEIRENMKFEIAGNSYIINNFLGQYNIAALNYDSPALTKVVARQMVSNAAAKGTPIDFALIFSYHFRKSEWHGTIIDDHKQTTIDMGDIAEQLGRKSGSSAGAGGHQHVGNFYWKGDILDLIYKTRL
jgi:hypothetical protein